MDTYENEEMGGIDDEEDYIINEEVELIYENVGTMDDEKETEEDKKKKRKNIEKKEDEDEEDEHPHLDKKKKSDFTPPPPTLSGSLLPPFSGASVNTFSGVDTGATFAVWNLCDLGGGHQSPHWTKNDSFALKLLPGEIKAINADVIGFLEIKTGHAVVAQLPKEKPRATAFEIGAMTGWMFERYIKLNEDKNQPGKKFSEILDELNQMMWVGDEPILLLTLKRGLESVGNMDTIFCLNDMETVAKEMIFNSSNYLFNLKEKEVIELYTWMWKKCSRFENSWYKDPTTDLDDLDDIDEFDEPKKNPTKIKNFWLEKKELLKKTWKYVQMAFENAGMKTEKEEKQPKEANGVPLLTEVFKNFVEVNKNYKSCFIDEVKGDGETTAFLYDENKFEPCCNGSIEISGYGWRFRSAGYIHLKCKPGTLNQEELMVVAWHAPSENNVGERQQSYSVLNFHLKDRGSRKGCLKNTNVILLADMNIRFKPQDCEAKIIEEAYDSWLPKSEDHMKLCTSLKKTGTGGTQWNHPFDKVLLLNHDSLKLKITGHERMKDSRSAEEIRVFSDHSWVKAKISTEIVFNF